MTVPLVGNLVIAVTSARTGWNGVPVRPDPWDYNGGLSGKGNHSRTHLGVWLGFSMGREKLDPDVRRTVYRAIAAGRAIPEKIMKMKVPLCGVIWTLGTPSDAVLVLYDERYTSLSIVG